MELVDKFQIFLDSSRKKLEEEIIHLKADHRADEADFIKIKFNIYGIANSFYGNAKRVSPQHIQDEYFKCFERSQLQKKWEDVYRTAKEFGDVDRMRIEELKLETLQEIYSKFVQIMQDGEGQ